MEQNSAIWLERIEQNHKIEKIIRTTSKNRGNEGSKWMILTMGKALEDAKLLEEEAEIERRLNAYMHPIELAVKVFRKHCCKTPPFCRSIYGLTHQLLALQLVMAQKSKMENGQFEAKVQDVITVHQKIMKNKLNGTPHDPEIQDIVNDYGKLLSHCNAMDYADLIASVKDYFNSDENVKDIYQKQNFVINGFPTSIYEVEIVCLLPGQRTVEKHSSRNEGNTLLSAEQFTEIIKQNAAPDTTSVQQLLPASTVIPSTPSNCKDKGHTPNTPQHLTILPLSPLQSQSPMLSQSPLSQERIMMGHTLSVFMSYLQLLVNSRDELALARVINTPCRELGVRQFNKIKQLAKSKNMSMFQMVTSFILQIRLGGKSYAPSTENPLHHMTKGLGEFVSFFQKLQNVIEEIDNPKAAVIKIIGTIQSTLIKAKDESLPSNDIRKASNFLKGQLENVCNDNVNIAVPENKSCMLGLQTYVLLCKILDSNIMYDYEENELQGVLQTPRRLQGKTSSLISTFRTPEAPTPKKVVEEKIQDNNKAKDLEEKFRIEKTKRTSIWQEVEILEDIQTEQTCSLLDTPISRKRPLEEPCGTLKNKTCSPLRKRPYESREDQENVAPTQKGTKENFTVKRGLLSTGGNEMSKEKKRKVVKSTAPKKKKKTVKVAKGQQQLTCFFR